MSKSKDGIMVIPALMEIDFDDLERCIEKDYRYYVKLKSRDEPYEVDENTYERVLAWIAEMNAKREELKPCPFCGSNDLYIITQMIEREAPFDNADDCTVGIFCNTCKQTVTLEANEDEGRDFGTEQRAIAAWNRREL